MYIERGDSYRLGVSSVEAQAGSLTSRKISIQRALPYAKSSNTKNS